MLVLMIGFFGVVIAVNLVMAVFATTTWTGLVVKNSYVASQHFNDRLAAARLQKKLGWKSTLDTKGGKFVFTIRDRSGQPVPDLAINGKLERLSSDRSDRMLWFKQASAGRYVTNAPAGSGRWKVDLTARGHAGRTYRQIFELTID